MIRRILLAVAALALLAVAALALLGGITAQPAAADSAGYRFDGKTICVENRASGTQYTAVSNIVHHANTYTNLSIWHRGWVGGCNGFAHRIIVRQAYSSDWWWSATTFPGGGYYCATSLGPRTVCLGSPALITLNTRYGLSSSSWHWAAAHELGAALGLKEITWTCDTVMRRHHSSCSTHPHALSWYDRVGTSAHPGINRIYAY